jgi:hypothetical protein
MRSEQQLQRNYFRELIHSYGVDTMYFRNNIDAYKELSGNNDFDFIYGEQSTMGYWLSSHLIVYMSSMGDTTLLNNIGFQTDGDMDAYVLIDDFTENFRDYVGMQVSSAFEVPVYGSVLSGDCYIVSGNVKNSILDGITSSSFTFSTSGLVSDDFVSGFKRNPRKYIDLVYRSKAYTTRDVIGDLEGTVSGILDATYSGTVSGIVRGNLKYHIEDTNGENGPYWNISPKAGDFFRLDFHEDNYEEYEITKIIDRNLQSDGINPLLSKYVWHMTCVRRDPSHEDIIKAVSNFDPNIESGTGKRQEAQTADLTAENDWIERVSNDIFDYSAGPVDSIDGVNSDSVYGEFDRD